MGTAPQRLSDRVKTVDERHDDLGTASRGRTPPTTRRD
jgi:hypothetical protein